MSEDPSHPADDLYRRLDVAPHASRDDIVHAYRRLAHGAHPDSHPGDPDATRRFRELNEAYEVLVDPARRASYDRAEHPIQVRVSAPSAPPGPAMLVDLGPAPVAPLRVGPVHVDPDPSAPHRTTPGLDPAAAALAEVLSGLLSAWRSSW